MRTSHSSGGPDEPDLLAARNRISLRNQRAAQMEVAGDDTVAVVDVNDIARKKEVIDQRNDASIRRAHGRANTSREVHAEVPACKSAIERSSRAEAGGNSGRSRSQK
jgi:hypothetical protein